MRVRIASAACIVSVAIVLTGFCSRALAQDVPPPIPTPLGTLVDIGGQSIHLYTTGQGSPTVLLENGTGDFSFIWALVQPRVSNFACVCSYDRGGYAWSQPGKRPRTFAQLALELHTALQRLHIDPPYVLVGQSYGGLVVRGFYARYSTEVVGMVLVDAVHEDQRVVYGGQPHRIRDGAQDRAAPEPVIALDTNFLDRARATALRPPAALPLEQPLNRLPMSLQRLWQWAASQPLTSMVQAAEIDWSPDELERMHRERLSNRATLGDLPLMVIARTKGGYADGMSISADSLERERRTLQKDLAALSRRGKLVFADSSGHNIHLEDPELVVRAIHEVIEQARQHER